MIIVKFRKFGMLMFSMILSRRSRTVSERFISSLRHSYHLIYHTLPKSAPNLESDNVP
jgi:hypothetical protein